MAHELEELIISYRGELAKVLVPCDEQEHVITVISTPEESGDGLYMDGAPVDPETGELVLAEASEEVLAAADNLARVWLEGGWKLSKDHKEIQSAVDRYQKARSAQQEEEAKKTTHIKSPTLSEPMCSTPVEQVFSYTDDPKSSTCVECLRMVAGKPYAQDEIPSV